MTRLPRGPLEETKIPGDNWGSRSAKHGNEVNAELLVLFWHLWELSIQIGDRPQIFKIVTGDRAIASKQIQLHFRQILQ